MCRRPPESRRGEAPVSWWPGTESNRRRADSQSDPTSTTNDGQTRPSQPDQHVPGYPVCPEDPLAAFGLCWSGASQGQVESAGSQGGLGAGLNRNGEQPVIRASTTAASSHSRRSRPHPASSPSSPSTSHMTRPVSGRRLPTALTAASPRHTGRPSTLTNPSACGNSIDPHHDVWCPVGHQGAPACPPIPGVAP
jgi:hypothetical protein